jgi:hypothetical protein
MPGSMHWVLGTEPGELGRLDALAQELLHLGDDIDVVRRLLHGLRVAAHVHQHHARPGVARDGEHRLVAAPRDVVHDARPRLEGGRRDLGLARVDRDREGRVVGGQSLDHGDDAGLLLVHRDRVGARPGRLAADVHEVGAVFLDACATPRHRGTDRRRRRVEVTFTTPITSVRSERRARGAGVPVQGQP